ncbi:hypothetical protein GF339_18505 [candidate division KSB3 bacterium]|uniref:FlgO domain-containing protein n=1 Tax=candidate division KSB3 bacterium TaxID=2044937 RepID=A0A9D5JYG3_9BACT|nr:hypothetical protein [candidate division KSB3 bacterium]MBD3326582.1 hypothetical protein [candidate division KSB3 bacterium]
MTMKTTRYPVVLLSLLSSLVIAGCAVTSREETPIPSSAKRIAVLSFPDQSRYTYGRLRYDGTEFMEQALRQTGQVQVIPREQWESQLGETQMSESPAIDDIQRAAALGKQIGADVVIIGVITQFHTDHEEMDSRLLTPRYEYNATARVRARVIDVAQAKILATESILGSAQTIARHVLSEGPVSVDSVHERTLLNQSVKNATKRLAPKLVKQL